MQVSVHLRTEVVARLGPALLLALGLIAGACAGDEDGEADASPVATASRVAVTPDADSGRWQPRFVRRIGQGRGDLGRRMDRALRRPPPGGVVLVGADIPGMTAAHLAAAFRALGSRPYVLGPATDGGYWLVGARRRPAFPYAFADVRWSTEHALADTLRNLPPGSVAEVARLHDVDRAEDLAPLGLRWHPSRAERAARRPGIST